MPEAEDLEVSRGLSVRQQAAGAPLPQTPGPSPLPSLDRHNGAAAAVWDEFERELERRGTNARDLLRATEAELEEILTDFGYRALERAQIRTAWYSRIGQKGTGPSAATVVAASSREFADVRVLLERYADIDVSRHTLSVIEVERLQNVVLEMRVARRTKQIPTDVAPVRRFHSTVSATGAKIQDCGFSLPPDSEQPCIRFLTRAASSFPAGVHKLLLCDVMVGKYKAVNGRGEGVTREQLDSEGFDSVYLFHAQQQARGPVSPERAGPPEEFLVFHADQALPRYAVTFLVHPRWGGDTTAALSPRSGVHLGSAGLGLLPPGDETARSHHVEPIPPPETARAATPAMAVECGSPALSHRSNASTGAISGGGSEALRYWLVSENQLVSADSLLVGEHRGKKFVSIAEGADKQMAALSQNGQTLIRSIDHLKHQLQQLSRQRDRQADERVGVHSQVRAQVQQLRELLDEKQADALRQVEEQMLLALGRLDDDCTTIAGHLDKLEGYSQRVNQMLLLARSSREQFLLRSGSFLDEMERWDPPFRFQPDVAIPAITTMRLDGAAARRGIAGLQVRQGEPEGEGRKSSPHRSHTRPRSQSPGTSVRRQQSPPADPDDAKQQGRPHRVSSPLRMPAAAPAAVTPPGGTPSRDGAATRRSAGTPQQRRAGRNAKSGPRMQTFTIALVGDSRVGKTRLMEAWKGLEAPTRAELESYVSTTEPEISGFTVVTSRGKVAVSIADCPGAQLCPEILGNVDAAVVVFDCTDSTSYANVSRWYSYLPYNTPVALCGNKSNEAGRVVRGRDITFHKEVNAALGESVVNYYDISVVSRYNVDKPWTWICRKLLKDAHLIVREIIAR
eukprot:TRINITY_DN15552_c0_g1_i1.p1 TRINITY_DN15552_c0_g1~~TRINITY_DN15552_c0_g1_i1.p1  ORF type:complete len:866 (+),score=225.98 TRINITY_DN15552_c0_g1_i1:47-2599(+)